MPGQDPQGFDFGGISKAQAPAGAGFDFEGIMPASKVRPTLQARGITDPQSVRVTEPPAEDLVDDPIGKLFVAGAKKLAPVIQAVGNWIAPATREAPAPAPSSTVPAQTAGRVLSTAGEIVRGGVEFPARVAADVSGITQAVQTLRGQQPTGVVAPGIAAQIQQGATQVKAAALKLQQAKTQTEQEQAVNELMFRITALPADVAGVPVSQIRDDITKGDYTHAAGLSLGVATVFGGLHALKVGARRAQAGPPVEVRAEAQRILTGEPRDLRTEAAPQGTAAPAGFDFEGIAKAGGSTAVAGPEFAPVGSEPVAAPKSAVVPNPNEPIEPMADVVGATQRMRAENPRLEQDAQQLATRMRAAVSPEPPRTGPTDQPAAPVYARIDAGQIRLSPGEYQFKASDVRGETGRLRDVQTWDPLQAQTTPVLLHERLDGTLYVADGHQRVNLAQRLEAKGVEVPPLNAVVLREADGWTAPEVRRTAALLNVRQDSASPIDIAKLLRERPLTEADRASIPRGNVYGERFRQAEDLAKLGDAAFQAVVNGEVEPAFARFVGQHLTDPAEQVAAIRALRDADLPNAFQAEQFVKALKTDEFSKAVEGDLFGEHVVAASLAKEKAQVLDAVRRQLASQKSAFGNALRNESRLREAGNVLATGENERLAGEAGRFQGLLTAFVDKSGHTQQALAEAARRLHAGEAKPAEVVTDVIAALEKDWRDAGGVRPSGEALRPAGVRPEDPGDRGTGGLVPPPNAPAVAPAVEPSGIAPAAIPEVVRAVLRKEFPNFPAARWAQDGTTLVQLPDEGQATAFRINVHADPPTVEAIGGASRQLQTFLQKRFADIVKRHPSVREALAAEPAERPAAPGAASSIVRSIPAPAGWKLEVGRTRTKEGHTAEAEVDWQGKRIVFSDQKHLDNPEIRNHEIAHVLIETLPDAKQKALFDDYIALKSQTAAWKKYGADWIVKNQFHREEIAMDAGDYFTHPEKLSSDLRALFDKHLKDAIPAEPSAGRGTLRAEDLAQYSKGDHQSSLPLGTHIDLMREGHGQVAIKVRTIPNGEEWRIEMGHRAGEGGYVYSEGWRYVQEHAIPRQGKADVLDTGEVQPRLPGAEGVRDQNIPTPAVAEAPFGLTAGAGEATEQASHGELEAAGQKNLFASMGTSGGRAPRAPAPAPEAASEPPLRPAPPEMRQRIEDWLAGKGGTGVVRVAHDIENTFGAPTIQGARTAANLFRMKLAELAQKGVSAEYALREARNRAARLSREQTLALADAIEAGEPVSKELESWVKTRNVLYDQRKRELARLGIDKEWMENYLPHAWAAGWKGGPTTVEGKFIQEWFGRRTLEGGKHFLKQRKIPTMREGVEAGFEPASWNLVDLDLLKLREMDKFIMARQLREEMKAQGLIQFGSALGERPEGLVQIDDPIGTVHAPPTITLKEAYDKQLMEGLQQFADSLGIPQTRKVNIGGTRWGYASSLEGMVTKFAGPETVLMHEIGHFIDWKYGLSKEWIKHPFSKAAKTDPMQAELRALADLRAESQSADITESFKKYIRRGEEKIANLVHAYIWNPERARQVAPNAYAALDGLVSRHPELRPLRTLQHSRSLELGSASVERQLPGPVLLGHYYARPEVARLFNNYLRPGLAGRSAIFDGYRWIGNNLNQLQLGFSAFHAGTSAINAVSSKVALALEHLAEGQPGPAALKLAEAPFAWFTDAMKGAKAIREYETANAGALELSDVTRQIIEGGGRVRMDSMYLNDSVRAFTQAIHDPNGLRKAGALWHVLPAALELSAKPVMQWYVPRLKIAAFLDLAEKEIGRLGPAAELADVRDVLARSWDSIDNRFGQLVYDNLFWPRVVKDLGMASVRSIGWNLGTFRELGGGLKDVVRRPLPGGREVRTIGGEPRLDPLVSHRTAFFAGMTFTVGLLGALYQVAHTGEWPGELRDYFFPKTGRKTPQGDDERVSLPSYMKDVYAFGRAPITTLSHKAHPEIGLLLDTWRNEDYYGNEIRNADDPWVQQARQYFDYLTKQAVPISVRNLLQRRQTGGTLGGQAESVVGISPAPALLTRSAAEEKIRDYLGPMHRSFEQAAVADQRREYRQGLQQGGDIGAEQMAGARATGLLTPQSVKRMQQERHFTGLDFGFPRLTLDQAFHVYDVMTPAERWRFKSRLEMKYRAAHLPPAERTEMHERLDRARALPASPKEPAGGGQ